MISTLCVVLIAASTAAFSAETPQLADDRLTISLFAESPEIVTPIGMVIDDQDRIFVVESHTHHPLADYAGPSHDRIKMFIDSDSDGQVDQVSVFADGLTQAMNIALSPEGQLYVVCAREVLRLEDRDSDGICDHQEQILQLVTQERYAHNCLLGITFDRDGWMYVARGNVGSHYYRFQGQDRSSVEGFGDGGNVVRCRSDGTQIEEFATGFWNPFDLKFDHFGRLLLVDNDPDARGPNRLLQVVRGGDYGYKSLYGGGGNHPFQGWDGTLPGTLPFIAGTGEAPSGVIDCRRAALPTGYDKSVLVTIWNENSIEKFDLQESGSTLTSSGRQPFVTGGKQFRPVAIDCDRRGNLFITDWVLVDYPNHGHGRIWRISPRAEIETSKPVSYFSTSPESPGMSQLRAIESVGHEDLIELLQSEDQFLVHAARMRLANSSMAQLRDLLQRHSSAAVRMGMLLASKQVKLDSPELIGAFLTDADIEIRRAAIMWAGESMNPSVRDDLDRVLTTGTASRPLFEAYLAAIENLNGDFAAAVLRRGPGRANQLMRELPAGLIAKIARDANQSISVRELAIEKLSDLELSQNSDWLQQLLNSTDDKLCVAVAKRYADTAVLQDGTQEILARLALDSSRDSEVRCEAIFALSRHLRDTVDDLLVLLSAPDQNVAIESARTIRAWLDRAAAASAASLVGQLQQSDLGGAVMERLAAAAALNKVNIDQKVQVPQTKEQWHEVLAEGGDALRGRRVFASDRVGCTKCHTVGGRGGTLGPDLAGVAWSKSRSQIIDSILDPSAEFAPQYQAWLVITSDGIIHRGLQLDHKAGGKINLTLSDGSLKQFAAEEIEDYQASPTSLMPTGLFEVMTIGEFQDLVAYLCSRSRGSEGK
ncbi:MAG: c-type cytochrome [Planctomycetales bacterium]|nr:c-type cytochrome [Planctomycetales bacterium]